MNIKELIGLQAYLLNSKPASRNEALLVLKNIEDAADKISQKLKQISMVIENGRFDGSRGAKLSSLSNANTRARIGGAKWK